ncbi:hypothetical protein [Herbidospora mongoliensis]|uniref:hypothetical protein n=1 Tax=Herbidospora mongoliensis TaxID=688067 RepID=UPI0012FA19F7|nr:hypothetical protein [Herbidospora mongoliensis]
MPEPTREYLWRRVCRATPDPKSCIHDDVILTHHSHDGIFGSAPRYDMERDMSLLTGKLTVVDATKYRKRKNQVFPRDLEMAAVRYTTAGLLRGGGFVVVHTPGAVVASCGEPLSHISVLWAEGDPLVEQRIPWPSGVSENFDKCFNEYREEGR